MPGGARAVAHGWRPKYTLHFVASFVGNFVAFVESRWWSLTEARRRGETEPRMDEMGANGREWTRMDGVFLNAKNAKNAKFGLSGWSKCAV